MAAGLAGGSTDAAAALAGLNELWGLKLPQTRLAGLAGRVGSDVAFFFQTPAAWCTGRGEKVEALKLDRPLWFVIVCPAVGLSTAEVYREGSVPVEPVNGAKVREALIGGDVEELGRNLHNRLQDAADRLRPELARVRQRLAELAPAGSLMSGSGTSCFALCRDEAEAWRIAQHLSRGAGGMETGRVYVVRSCL
jgi:4-diphosphocytidyl-2-C-methyl-D-erythritol kinase